MAQDGAEHEGKAERVAALARALGAGGVLVAAHHNIAWLTGGRGNRVDSSREIGSARLLIRADGGRFVLANAIEMPRLLDEVLPGYGYEPIEYSWTDDQADPARALTMARGLTRSDTIAADWPLPGTTPAETALMRTRTHLTPDEVERYRALGRDVAGAVTRLCHNLAPGDDERHIARSAAEAVANVGARAIVTLVGSDERLRRYRHPVPTAARWRHIVMTAVCAERDGLVVSMSRIVADRAAAAEIAGRTRAAAGVFDTLLAASRDRHGASALYHTAAAAYRDAGFPGEEQRHHQGGAIAYRAREWIAHPASQETVHPTEAFAWNPTITGTKIEDTALLVNRRVEIVTATPDWPSLPLPSFDNLHAADVWRLP